MDEIQAKFFPTVTEPIEFRASAIWNANGEPWKSLQRTKRNEVLAAIYSLLGRETKGISLFGVAIQKADYPKISPIQRTCEEMAGHFDAYLTGLEIGGPTERQRGLMIFDQSRHEKTVQALMAQYRTTGASFGKIRHLAEAPLFTDSKITRMLQLADFVAYAIYKRYESGFAQYLDAILPRFHESGGKIHGLVHLNANHKACYCQPCLSLRMLPGSMAAV